MGSEIRYAVRQLLRSPGFTLVAVLGLALGIGANVALFSVVNSVFLRPLPYHDRSGWCSLELDERGPEPHPRRVLVSALSRGAAAAAGVQRPRALGRQRLHLTGRGDPEQLIGLQASAAMLPALGLQPLLGRNFSANEDRPGGEHVVLISHALWQQRFNSDPAVLGQALTLDGAPYTIIGVLPEAATAFPLNQLQIWVPRPAEVPFLVAVAAEQRRLLLPGHCAAEAGRLAGAGARGDERDRRGLPKGEPGQRRRAVADRARAAPDDAVGAQRQSYLLLFGAVAACC